MNRLIIQHTFASILTGTRILPSFVVMGLLVAILGVGQSSADAAPGKPPLQKVKKEQVLVDFNKTPQFRRVYGNVDAASIVTLDDSKAFRFDYKATDQGVPHCGYRVPTATVSVGVDSVLVFRYRARKVSDLRMAMMLSNQRVSWSLKLAPSGEWREVRLPLAEKLTAGIDNVACRDLYLTTFAQRNAQEQVEPGYLEIDGFRLAINTSATEADKITTRNRIEKEGQDLSNLKRFVRVANVVTDRAKFKTSEQITIRYSIVNTSEQDLAVPVNTQFSRPMRLLGSVQKWIEYIGPDNRPRRMPDGGAVLPYRRTVLNANARIDQAHTLRRKLEPGRYRYLIEFKSTEGKRLNIESTEFVVEGS